MTEMTPVVVHADPEQGHLLAEPVHGAAPVAHVHVVDPQHAGAPRKHASPVKPIIALFLLALAVTLFGLLAFQAQAAFGGFLVSDANSTDLSGEDASVGFNGAGSGLFLFGILFAVLQAVTAYTMWLHIAYYLPHFRHSSIVGPLKVTAAVGFIAMGFACRHINLGAREDTSWLHLTITHAIEAFIIINWFFVILVLILCLTKINWDCENLEDHRITRRMAAGYAQFDLAIVLIGLLAGYFQLMTEGYYSNVSSSTIMFITFAILFAVLQAISGVTMIQQCGHGAPGQLSETVHALLKVVIAFGLVAFGFACRSIYVTTHGVGASAHLVAIEAFVIINFIVTLYLTYSTAHGSLAWDNNNVIEGKRTKGLLFGILHLIFSIVLFGLLAGLIQGLTGNDMDSFASLNAAGTFMVLFGLLFSVLEFFTGCTMLESGTKKLGGLNPSAVSVTSKVTLAIGALAFGFACRHINLTQRVSGEGPRSPLVHAIESFIIINFFLTWLIDVLAVKGKIEW